MRPHLLAFSATRPLVVLALVARLLGAQCQSGWSTEFASPFLSGPPQGVLTFDDGSGSALYAYGSFTHAGGEPVPGLARWNGAWWKGLPPPATSGAAVSALTPFVDSTGSSLYAAFSIPGTLATQVERWDGFSWFPIGTQLPRVEALGVHDDGTGAAVYAGTFNGGVFKCVNLAWVPVGALAGYIRGLLSWNGSLYATGALTLVGGGFGAGVAVWNGISWSQVGTGLGGVSGHALATFDDGTGVRLYVAGDFTSGIARWSGSAWSAVGSGLSGPGGALGKGKVLRVFDDGSGAALYVGGAFRSAGGVTAPGIARYSSAGWQALGPGLTIPNVFPATGDVDGLGVFDDGTGPVLFACGPFESWGSIVTRWVAGWSGSAWSPLSGNALSGKVEALLAADTGGGPALYAAGGFNLAGAMLSSGVARWSHARWESLGSSVNTPAGIVEALASYDEGSGPRLFAGGLLNQIFGVQGGVVRWNGTAWTSVGGGLTQGTGNGHVRALAVYDDGSGPSLYAGGWFDAAGGVPALNVAKWNGASWSAAGGIGGVTITELATGDLGAGSELFTAGTSGVVSFVARRSGPSWQIIGTTPPNEWINALKIFDDGTGPALYAAGTFTSMAGVPASLLAKWNGAWSAVMPPIAGAIDALEVHDDGSGPALYAMGSAQLGVPVSGVARLSGGSWSVLGQIVNTGTGAAGLTSLVTLDDGTGQHLYAGGGFTHVNATSSGNLARWGAFAPSVELAQPGGAATGITVRNAWLLKSHEYYNVWSVSPCPGAPGSGPIIGLCAPNLSDLLSQFAMPIGALPFHFIAPAGTMTSGPYVGLPAGLTVDGVCFDWTGGVLGCVGKVTRFTVQ